MFLLKIPRDWNSLRSIPIKSNVTYLSPLKKISRTESPNTVKKLGSIAFTVPAFISLNLAFEYLSSVNLYELISLDTKFTILIKNRLSNTFSTPLLDSSK